MKDYEYYFYLNNDTILNSLILNEENKEQNLARKLFEDKQKYYIKLNDYYKAREEDEKRKKQKKQEQIAVKIDTKQIEKELEKLFS